MAVRTKAHRAALVVFLALVAQMVVLPASAAPRYLAVGDVEVTEKDPGDTLKAVFSVEISTAHTRKVTVDYTTKNGTAKSNKDYIAKSGTLTFEPGQVKKTVRVTINPDNLYEAAEKFKLKLTNPSRATLTDNVGVATIVNDDAPPIASIADTSMAEGAAGTSSPMEFTVTLSEPSGVRASFEYYALSELTGTTTWGEDFQPTNATLVIPAGEVTGEVSVPIIGDDLPEPDESFKAVLHNPAHATIGDAEAFGIIEDDDPGGGGLALYIADSTLSEHTSPNGLSTMVRLSAPSDEVITVQVDEVIDSTGPHPASSDDFYDYNIPTLTFNPGVVFQQYPYAFKVDDIDEHAETYLIKLSNPTGTDVYIADDTGVITILDNDPSPSMSIHDVEMLEGNVGGANASLTVTLDNESGKVVTAQYSTTAGTAQATDFTPSSGTITFTPGDTSEQIVIPVNTNQIQELDESFTVTLSNPVEASIADSTATVLLHNDDQAKERGLVINEIDYDQPGTDNAEFVEILNAGTTPVDLTDKALVLINGSTSASEYGRVVLFGTLNPGEYFLIASTGMTGADATLGGTAIQNGSPDGVALVDTGADAVLDVLSYEGTINNAAFGGITGVHSLVEGNATPLIDDDDNTHLALQRYPNGIDSDDANSDWSLGTPTPGAAN